MSDEMLQKTIDLVSSLEAKNETQQIAKYELIEYVERLQQENQKLKKQLEKKYSKTGTLTNEVLYEENTKLINQKKEFIEYLEDEIKATEDKLTKYEGLLKQGKETDIEYYESMINRGMFAAHKDILSKYKEIIGYKDEYESEITDVKD